MKLLDDLPNGTKLTLNTRDHPFRGNVSFERSLTRSKEEFADFLERHEQYLWQFNLAIKFFPTKSYISGDHNASFPIYIEPEDFEKEADKLREM